MKTLIYTYLFSTLINCLLIYAGIWSAAMDGDMDRVKSLIKKGVDPNLRDSSRYTALVRVPEDTHSMH